MKIFELHFNAKAKEDTIFDSFVYEPENIFEKRLGSLYVVGELQKAMPQNSHLLNNLSSLIKKEYYSAGLKKSPEVSLQEALKKANDFLDVETKKGNVSWLGNLSLAVLNCQDFVLNFTRVGDIKIFLQRNQDTLDISQKLEFQNLEPYPLKVFGNIATGKLAPDDKVIVLTKDALSKDFLTELSQASDVKEVLRTKKQILDDLSGICLLLMLQDESLPVESISFGRELPKISFSLPRVKFAIPRKRTLLVLGLILLLAVGFLVFR